ncbi:hypothetical protein GCM10022378_00110 [Salinicoccus jeotgali]|uniref:Conjugal transfer protein n=1 Tax=Salinicoccus jeotgali TaxID=381634 RepID=A0ABP7E1Y1_9STAP
MKNDVKIMGNNYTQELKYPIKIYKIFQGTKYEIQFSKGIELKKIITGVFAVFLMLILMTISIRIGSTDTLLFILNNWLIVLVAGVAITLIVVFSLNYDYKPIHDYFKDRYTFYRTRHISFEHDIEVDESFGKPIQYEAFKRSDD